MHSTDTYRQHLDALDRHLDASLAEARRQGLALEAVLFHAGRARAYHRDDHEIAFHTSPHLLRWVPLEGPEHVVLVRPGARPKVVRVRPRDYWYDTSAPPASDWEAVVDFEEVETFAQAVAALGPLAHTAFVGEAAEAAAEAGIPATLVEPAALMAPLDWYRAYKTPHEVANLRLAAERTAPGYVAAGDAFAAGGSEREIFAAYLQGSNQLESEQPYGGIIALDEKSATLHYQHKRGREAAPGRVLLVDAGAACRGYASDVTRTWARPDVEPAFQQLIAGVDALERELVEMVEPGRPYLEIHLAAHRKIAALLAEVGIVKGSGEQAYERGIARTFMPHGVGHHLGLQVHDVGGHQAGPAGGRVPPPPEFPYLRNTRLLEPGHFVTIEPGIYFIPILLDPLRASAEAALLDWDLIDRLTPLGGVRIEDDVLCTEDGHRDLTRDLIPGPRGI